MYEERVFFVEQKAAYEMLSSDGSSDVCSSDLRYISVCWHYHPNEGSLDATRADDADAGGERFDMAGSQARSPGNRMALLEPLATVWRSAERRVGKACGSTCSSRWWPAHEKKNMPHY